MENQSIIISAKSKNIVTGNETNMVAKANANTNISIRTYASSNASTKAYAMENSIPVIQRYKDTVFRKIFMNPKELLSLYNAVNDTHYNNPEELEVTTLENAIYMNMKNDVSCVLDMWMNLYEHQSTVNPNIPLRDLFYTSRLYENMIVKRDIYSSKPIMLPAPKFITFYNGVEQQPERRIMKLPNPVPVHAIRRKGKNLQGDYAYRKGSRKISGRVHSRRDIKGLPYKKQSGGDTDEHIRV